jgi:hypothetical protein
MNERIRELAEQARKHFPKTETSGEFWVFDEEKFAELIVRECADVGSKFSMAHPEDIRYQIKRHFGVEV